MNFSRGHIGDNVSDVAGPEKGGAVVKGVTSAPKGGESKNPAVAFVMAGARKPRFTDEFSRLPGTNFWLRTRTARRSPKGCR